MEIINLLNEINKKIEYDKKDIKCYFSKGKFIIFIDFEIINVGFLNEVDEFIMDYLIQSNNSLNRRNDLYNCFYSFVLNDFKYIENNLPLNLKKYNINNISIDKQISKLNNLDKIGIDIYNIKEKVKTLILLSIFQNKSYKNYFNIEKEKVFLINNIWLIDYQINNIISLIEENNEVRNFIEKINNYELLYNETYIFNNIISKLNIEELIKIQEKIEKYSSKKCEANAEEITINKKIIKIYKDFILVNQKMFDLFFINFGIHSTAKEIFYYYKDGDIISVYDYSQSLLYFGNINKKDNYYNIKYIFDFENQNFLYKELDIIKKIGIENYINNYAVFSDKNIKIIYPLFSLIQEILVIVINIILELIIIFVLIIMII